MMESTKRVDWGGLAEKLGTVTRTESGYSETGGSGIAAKLIVEIMGDQVWRDAVDFYVSGKPGAEGARSVLWMLRPPAAMNRCNEIFLTTNDYETASFAICLLQVVADRRVLDWIPQYLASANKGARIWGLGIVDQLLIMNEEITLNEAMPLIETGLIDPDESVQRQARQILEMVEGEKQLRDDKIGNPA